MSTPKQGTGLPALTNALLDYVAATPGGPAVLRLLLSQLEAEQARRAALRATPPAEEHRHAAPDQAHP